MDPSAGGRRLVTAFGNYIRAARLGFHWSEAIRAWVRVGVLNRNDRWLVEVAPQDHVPNKAQTRTYVCWWDRNASEEAETIIRLSPVLSAIREPDSYRSYILGDDGKEIT